MRRHGRSGARSDGALGGFVAGLIFAAPEFCAGLAVVTDGAFELTALFLGPESIADDGHGRPGITNRATPEFGWGSCVPVCGREWRRDGAIAIVSAVAGPVESGDFECCGSAGRCGGRCSGCRRGIGFEPFAGAFGSAGGAPAEDKSGTHVAVEPDAANAGEGEKSAGEHGGEPDADPFGFLQGGKAEPPDAEAENQETCSVVHADDLIGATVGQLMGSRGGDCGEQQENRRGKNISAAEKCGCHVAGALWACF